MINKWITRRELAEELGVTPQDIYRNRASLGLKMFEYRINNRVVRYEREPLFKHLRHIGIMPLS